VYWCKSVLYKLNFWVGDFICEWRLKGCMGWKRLRTTGIYCAMYIFVFFYFLPHLHEPSSRTPLVRSPLIGKIWRRLQKGDLFSDEHMVALHVALVWMQTQSWKPWKLADNCFCLYFPYCFPCSAQWWVCLWWSTCYLNTVCWLRKVSYIDLHKQNLCICNFKFLGHREDHVCI